MVGTLMAHWSSCATNNGPALPIGPCDCGGGAPEVDAQNRWPDVSHIKLGPSFDADFWEQWCKADPL